MMRVIFSIYLAVTCLITSMEFLTEYVKTQDSIISELKQLEESVLHPISTSLWQYNQDQLEALVAGLLKIPIIKGIDILDKYNQPMISQRSYTTDLTPLSIFDIKSDLNWQLNEQKNSLNHLPFISRQRLFEIEFCSDFP
jgi:hypothetical protein